jgi:hypothetical protein
VADGLLPEVTNGRFVDAKVEKRALSIGQLWRSPTGGSGSGLASRFGELVGLKLSSKLMMPVS